MLARQYSRKSHGRRFETSPGSPADGWSIPARAVAAVVVAPVRAAVLTPQHLVQNIWPHLKATVLRAALRLGFRV